MSQAVQVGDRLLTGIQAFSAWKLAIVLEGSYAKHLRGESKNPTHGYLGFTIDRLLGRAQRFAV